MKSSNAAPHSRPKGRALYDRLLNAARDELKDFPNEANAARYNALMTQHFGEFPDTYEGMRRQELAYFRYFVTEKGLAARCAENLVAGRSAQRRLFAG